MIMIGSETEQHVVLTRHPHAERANCSCWSLTHTPVKKGTLQEGPSLLSPCSPLSAAVVQTFWAATFSPKMDKARPLWCHFTEMSYQTLQIDSKQALAPSYSTAFLLCDLHFCWDHHHLLRHESLMASLMLSFPLPVTSAQGLVLSIPSLICLYFCPVFPFTLPSLGKAGRKLAACLCQIGALHGRGLHLSHHGGSEMVVPRLTDGRSSVSSAQ